MNRHQNCLKIGDTNKQEISNMFCFTVQLTILTYTNMNIGAPTMRWKMTASFPFKKGSSCFMLIWKSICDIISSSLNKEHSTLQSPFASKGSLGGVARGGYFSVTYQ